MSENEEVEGVYNCEDEKEVKICSNHGYQVPLIWTFAFDGSEYWCPHCGFTGGMFGSGESVTETQELFERKKKYKELSMEYLDALTTFACQSLEFDGKRISPKDLPQEEKDRLRAIIDAWKYEVKVD